MLIVYKTSPSVPAQADFLSFLFLKKGTETELNIITGTGGGPHRAEDGEHTPVIAVQTEDRSLVSPAVEFLIKIIDRFYNLRKNRENSSGAFFIMNVSGAAKLASPGDPLLPSEGNTRKTQRRWKNSSSGGCRRVWWSLFFITRSCQSSVESVGSIGSCCCCC